LASPIGASDWRFLSEGEQIAKGMPKVRILPADRQAKGWKKDIVRKEYAKRIERKKCGK